MPTIQQLVRKGRTKILRRVNRLLCRLVLKDVEFVHVFILQRQKNLIQQCVKLPELD